MLHAGALVRPVARSVGLRFRHFFFGSADWRTPNAETNRTETAEEIKTF